MLHYCLMSHLLLIDLMTVRWGCFEVRGKNERRWFAASRFGMVLSSSRSLL